MAQLYTTPNAGTVPGQQYDMNQQIVQASAGNFQGLPSNQALGDQAATTAQGLAGMQTPDARGAYVQNSDIPAMQTNYDDLAKRLYDYDKMSLQPRYGGQPGEQPGGASFGRVEGSSLSQLTPEAVSTGGVGIKNANPLFGMGAQIDQGNDILSLMSTLNDSIDKEFSSRKGTYASAVKSKQTLLESIFQLMKLKSDEEARQEARAQRGSDKASATREKNISKFYTQAEKVKDDFNAGRYSTGNPQAAWGKAWGQLKGMADRLGLGEDITNEDIDLALGGKAYQDESGNWQGEGNANSDILKDIYLKGRPAAQQNAVPGLEAAVSNIKSARTNYNSAWAKDPILQNPALANTLSKVPGVGNYLASTVNSSAYNYIKDVEGVLGTQVAKGIGGDVGALANKDIDRAKSELADLGTNPAVGRQRLDKAVMHATQALMRLTKDKVQVINPKTGKKVEVDTPAELEQVFGKGYTYIQ